MFRSLRSIMMRAASGQDCHLSTPSMEAAGRLPLAAGDAHMARHGRTAMAPVDDEIMPFGLAADRLRDRRVERAVLGAGAQRRAEIGRIFLAEAHVERAGTG